MRIDNEFNLSMRFCYDQGIPHSQFLEWDESDRSKIYAWMLEEAEKCALCGTAEWEWDADRRAYEPVEHFCMGCYLKSIADTDAVNIGGTTIKLVSTHGVTAAQRYVKRKEDHERARDRRQQQLAERQRRDHG